MMKPKLLLIFSAVLLSLALVACNSTGDTPKETTLPTTENTAATEAVNTTEIPTSVPTEAPAEVITEAPTEVPTEAPPVVVTEAPTETPTEIPAEAPSEVLTEVVTEAPAETPTEAPTEAETEPSIKDVLGLDVSLSDLSDLMQPIFSGTTSVNETVMFLDYGETKTLLYPIDTVISVTSYDGQTVYEEGKDYVVEDGNLILPEGSAIPCITSEKFYHSPGSQLMTEYEGEDVYTHWGEGKIMTDWQVNVSYTHAEGWDGFSQTCELEVLQDFVKKLQAGEDVTVLFYGDSITTGATSSWLWNYAPYRDSYPHLLVKALADLFGYTVRFQPTNLTSINGMGTPMVPAEDYVAGDRGVITYINTAVGGWTSDNAVTYFDEYVGDWIENYGCDLMVIAFGMNDGAVNIGPRITAKNLGKVMDGVWAMDESVNIILMSTIMPNPHAVNGWLNYQDKQEKYLDDLMDDYRKENKPCAMTYMTSLSRSILERKDFHDYSGNNINHPNDYFSRVYAQILLETLLGYENMN